MIKLLLLLLYLASILGVVFVERKNPTEGLFWVLILICVPYVGLILYLVFGSTVSIKLTAFLRRKRMAQQVELPKKEAKAEYWKQLSEEDRQVARFNGVYNGSALTCYQDAQLFTCGADHYKKLFSDLKGAQECIYIEFYTIHHDIMGESLVKTLTRKAEEGVKVLVLIDFLANVSTPAKMFAPLKAAGGQVIRVKPYLTHFRSHRKIVAIDHKIGYIGGMNIGKQYANMAEKKNPWRDTQVRLTGACVAVLDEDFLKDWVSAVKRNRWQDTVQYVKKLQQPRYEDSPNLCQFIMGGVDTRKESVKMCYMSLIRSAKKRIRIQSPYFIPDASVLDALKTAAATGVEIELMIPGIKASFFLDPVTTYYSGQLLEFGAKIYKYQGYIHAKTMVIDDEICCIGSVNMDMRSLQVDDEICGVFYNNELVRRYNQIYAEDIGHCDPYTAEAYAARTRKERMAESFFLLFAPLM